MSKFHDVSEERTTARAPATMMFVFAEDATLHIAAGIEEVRRICEPIDVESSVFTFYDREGRPLIPRFTKPNRRRRILGLLSTIEQGEYTLDVADPATQDPIGVALLETAMLEPNPWFADLEAVRDYLVNRGAL
jgi:hypothetical protein